MFSGLAKYLQFTDICLEANDASLVLPSSSSSSQGSPLKHGGTWLRLRLPAAMRQKTSVMLVLSDQIYHFQFWYRYVPPYVLSLLQLPWRLWSVHTCSRGYWLICIVVVIEKKRAMVNMDSMDAHDHESAAFIWRKPGGLGSCLLQHC